jgi:hypothetical protein
MTSPLHTLSFTLMLRVLQRHAKGGRVEEGGKQARNQKGVDHNAMTLAYNSYETQTMHRRMCGKLVVVPARIMPFPKTREIKEGNVMWRSCLDGWNRKTVTKQHLQHLSHLYSLNILSATCAVDNGSDLTNSPRKRVRLSL